jgi:CBS domain-containing protein
MNKTPIAVKDSTGLDEAIKLMQDRHLLNLPVEKEGKVAYSITRHDLLRAKIGLGLDIEDVVT